MFSITQLYKKKICFLLCHEKRILNFYYVLTKGRLGINQLTVKIKLFDALNFVNLTLNLVSFF